MVLGAISLPLYIAISNDSESTPGTIPNAAADVTAPTASPAEQGIDLRTQISSLPLETEVGPSLEDARRLFLQEMAEAFDARDRLLACIDKVKSDPEVSRAAADGLVEEAATLSSSLGGLVEVERDVEYRSRLGAAAATLEDARVGAVAAIAGQSGTAAFRALGPLKRAMKALDKGSRRRIW